MKTCGKCGEVKPFEGFYNRSAKCKPCARAAAAQNRAANLEHVREYDRQRRSNIEVERIRKAKYVGRYNERIAAWARANPEKVRAAAAAREARRCAMKLKATPAWADPLKIKAIYAEAAFLRNIGVDVHVDHVIPLRGRLVCGLHVENNLQILLALDNQRKSATLLPEHAHA